MNLYGKDIVELYQSGWSISKISKEYSIPYRKIQVLLVEKGIEIRGGRNKKTLTEEQFSELKQRYCENSESLKSLSKIFNLSQETLRRIINEHKLKKKTNNRINKSIKQDYFHNIDSESKAYFLGLLFTDGSVDKKTETHQGRIRLQLQSTDKEILDIMREELGISSHLTVDPRGNGCHSLEFACQEMFEDLSKFGIVPNKTYRTKGIDIKKIPSHLIPHFTRGLFDGDGCITLSIDGKDATVNFTSYFEETVRDFQKIVDSLIGKSESNKCFFTSAWHCQWRGRQQCLKIFQALYNSPPSKYKIERKYKKFLELKRTLSQS